MARHAWPHPTDSRSLRCHFFVVTVYMQPPPPRYHLFPSRYIDNQRILQYDWIRAHFSQ